MKVLVAYSSRHGATRGIAERIATTLEREDIPVAFKSIEEVEWVDGFDAFVVGSSAYMGHWEKDAQAFVREHADVLATKPVWLFSSGPVGAEKVDKQGNDVLEASRPAEFAEFATQIHPRSEQVFFGLYDPERPDATLGEKLILKMPGMRELLPSGDFRDWPAIEAWAEGIARELKPALATAATTA
jgi:menaquinone-dependent protoporphyrinogen oxidase